jgi:queuine tRNA-ribosyltransferase
MRRIVEHCAPRLPAHAPRYLMGVGTPEDLLEGIRHGVDMFDCVIPTRNGRTGSAFTSRGKLNIRNAKFAVDKQPLDPDCGCSVCRRYSLAYLRHMYMAGEMGAAILISHHNVAFFLDTMRAARAAILSGTFEPFRREFINKLASNDAAGV